HHPLQARERDALALAVPLALPEVVYLLPLSVLDVAFDSVVTDVQPAPQLPLRVGRLPLVELVEGLEPSDPLPALLGPEFLEFLLVDVRRGIGLAGEVRVRLVPPLLQVEGVDRVAGAHVFRRHQLPPGFS